MKLKYHRVKKVGLKRASRKADETIHEGVEMPCKADKKFSSEINVLYETNDDNVGSIARE
jgi:hypothetical protein